ncbi:hypothetical protein DMN91_004303 [Ooceraea biroi]|uniref:Uncharacterized protein n=1 Tax=Ooceraea biroi TaxID=2015173 RepID=A0A3L8DUL9_OOCBI|nr:hypothetical protein DMN91_004303 [Ooceraea biroi]
MGSGQSARKLTISNEEDLGVIKVSNAIVQRLAQGEAMIDKSSSAKYDTAIQHSAVSSTPIIPPQADAAAVHPMHYYPELTMSALQIQQRKEEELKQQEQYWQRRLQNLKEGYQRIERTLEEEYKKAVNETSVAQVGKLNYYLILLQFDNDTKLLLKIQHNHVYRIVIKSYNVSKIIQKKLLDVPI